MWSLLFGGGLFTKVAMVVLFAALVAAAGYSIVKKSELALSQHKVAGLEVKVTQLQTDNAILKKNVETITKVNETNVDTNNKLIEERKDSIAAIAELAKQKASNKKKLDDMNKFIDVLLKDPKNNGTVSPVLKETIKSIQGKKRNENQ